MIDLLITHAGELVTCRTDAAGAIGSALDDLEIIPDGAVAVDGGRILCECHGDRGAGRGGRA